MNLSDRGIVGVLFSSCGRLCGGKCEKRPRDAADVRRMGRRDDARSMSIFIWLVHCRCGLTLERVDQKTSWSSSWKREFTF